MADHHGAGIRVAGAGFGTLPVAVIVIGAHAGVTLQSFTCRKQRRSRSYYTDCNRRTKESQHKKQTRKRALISGVSFYFEGCFEQKSGSESVTT